MTAPTPTSTWSANRRAAKAVVLNAQDTDDARMLLDMLGLVDGPQGREVLPDDTRFIDVDPHRTAPGRDRRDDDEPLSSQVGRTHTVPAGLAATPTTPVKARARTTRTTRPAAAAAVDVLPDPPAETTLSGRRKVAACGTLSGYFRHRRNKQDACAPCKKAMADYSRARVQARKVAAR